MQLSDDDFNRFDYLFDDGNAPLSKQQARLIEVERAALHSHIGYSIKMIDIYLIHLRMKYESVSDDVLLPIAAQLAAQSPLRRDIPTTDRGRG